MKYFLLLLVAPACIYGSQFLGTHVTGTMLCCILAALLCILCCCAVAAVFISGHRQRPAIPAEWSSPDPQATYVCGWDTGSKPSQSISAAFRLEHGELRHLGSYPVHIDEYRSSSDH